MIENLRSLAILVAVVEKGSFRGGGQKLGLSSSVVSHHISNLEKRLGCVLFHRVSRKLALTPKGEVLYRAAREMVEVVGAGLSAITEGNSPACGVLKIAVPQVLTRGKFFETLEEFMASFPRAGLKISQLNGILNPVDDGYDVVLTRNIPGDARLGSRPVKKVAFTCVAAPDLVQRMCNMPISEILEQIPFIRAPGFDNSDWLGILEATGYSREGTFNFRLETDDIAVAYRMACSGAGLLALPLEFAADDINSGRLERVLEQFPQPEQQFYAIYPIAAEDSPLLAHFLDHLVLQNTLQEAAE